MPVTIKPTTHPANPVSKPPLQDPETVLLKACLQDEYRKVLEIKESSFGACQVANIYPSRNGFVQASIDAYSKHQHLRLRPEDIWFAILSQLSKYINANAEELRDKFVSHAGQMKLEILAEATLGQFAIMMGGMIQENVKDPGLKEWIMPAFSTTTETDIIVASVIMMAQLQCYFTYQFDPTTCGLPSVTLLGEKADWEKIEKKLEKLADFGEQPTKWLRLLKPVLKRMVMSFDDPMGEEVLLFWNRIAHYTSQGSGSDSYSGWITAFCFWDDDGKCLYSNTFVQFIGEEHARNRAATLEWEWGRDVLLCLDDVFYGMIETQMVPTGYASVPVQVCEDGIGPGYECVMVAGSVGIEFTDIRVPEVQISRAEIKPDASGPRDMSKWKSFTSILMAVCQFGTSQSSGPSEPATIGLNKTAPSITKVGKGTEAEIKAGDLGSSENKQSEEVTKSTEVEQSFTSTADPEASNERQTQSPNEPATTGQITQKSLQPLNEIDTADLQVDTENSGLSNSERSIIAFLQDPATESFWAGSTVTGNKTVTVQSEPTVRAEEDFVDEEDAVDEEAEVATSATRKRKFGGGAAKGKFGREHWRNKGPMNTISPVTGWWIYHEKK